MEPLTDQQLLELKTNRDIYLKDKKIRVKPKRKKDKANRRKNRK